MPTLVLFRIVTRYLMNGISELIAWIGAIMPFLGPKIVFVGKDIIVGHEGYQPREESTPYSALFGAESNGIGLGNTFIWNLNYE